MSIPKVPLNANLGISPEYCINLQKHLQSAFQNVTDSSQGTQERLRYYYVKILKKNTILCAIGDFIVR